VSSSSLARMGDIIPEYLTRIVVTVVTWSNEATVDAASCNRVGEGVAIAHVWLEEGAVSDTALLVGKVIACFVHS